MIAPLKTSVLFTLLLTASTLAFAAEPPPYRFPSEIDRPQSVFDNKSSHVRDPFFPKSTRAPYFQPKDTTPGKDSVARPPEIKLTLKSIIVGSGRNLAMINNQTFEEGETAMVRLPSGGQVRVRCLKINDRSVTVTVEGKNDQTELRLLDK